ncbi:MAG: kynureninase [Bacillota bacterium]|jgi:kynureninase|nr:kynureninase [Bacillota bacterium]
MEQELATQFLTEEFARELDRTDELAHFRDRFYVMPGVIYMDGNSLGLLSRDAEEALLNVLNDWKTLGIDGWTRAKSPWFYLAEELGRAEASLVGAQPDEVIVTASTTLNLHNLLAAFYRPQGRRRKILADELNFPSDKYALESHLRLHGLDPEEDLILVRSRDGRTLEEKDIIAELTDEVAVAVLPSVLYRSGQLLNLSLLTYAAHERGVIIGFDLSHSAGVVPHKLHAWDVDFAFWCNYKYLNGGPGAVASLFVHQKHFDRLPGLAGWWGYRKDRQFDLCLQFEPAVGAGAWQAGTPHILSLAPLAGSLKIFQEAGMERLRAKSLALTSYLMYLIDALLSGPPYNYSIGTPREPERRGGHVAVEHEEAVRINAALKRRGVIPDFRPPNIIRLAPVPLYVSFHDVWQVVQHLKEIIETKEYEKFPRERDTVA